MSVTNKPRRVIYIAGPITGVSEYRANFRAAEVALTKRGCIVFSPAYMPEGLPHEAYMPICFAMMDACDTIYLLTGWEKSKGAKMEKEYAFKKGMDIIHEKEDTTECES